MASHQHRFFFSWASAPNSPALNVSIFRCSLLVLKLALEHVQHVTEPSQDGFCLRRSKHAPQASDKCLGVGDRVEVGLPGETRDEVLLHTR